MMPRARLIYNTSRANILNLAKNFTLNDASLFFYKAYSNYHKNPLRLLIRFKSTNKVLKTYPTLSARKMSISSRIAPLQVVKRFSCWQRQVCAIHWAIRRFVCHNLWSGVNLLHVYRDRFYWRDCCDEQRVWWNYYFHSYKAIFAF